MRILYSHRVQSHDGQGVHIEELIRALREAGHEVQVVGPAAFARTEFGGENRFYAAIRRLLPGALGELAELAYTIPAYFRLKRAWRSFRPDLVYERCNLYFLAGAWLARRYGVPLYLEVNAPLAAERGKFGGLKFPKLAAYLEKWTWRSASRVLPVTAVLGDMVRDAGVPPERISVVPNGIDLARFPPAEPRPADGPVTLGFVGFVRSWHGLDQVIDGMAAAPYAGQLRLIIVGDGPAIPDLKIQAARLGMTDRVIFAGLVQPTDVPAMVQKFDIALQPQATLYASPLKIFDYMAAGCAIVGPDQPNIREILTDGQDSILFDPADAANFWPAVTRLIEDAALRGQIGRAARATLERRNFTWAGNAARIAAWASNVKAAGV